MLANCKGFTLIEVTISLAMITIIIAATAPLFTTVLQERQTVKQQLFAYEIIQNTLEEYRTTNEEPIEESSISKDGTDYLLTVRQKTEDMIEICIKWKGKNGRNYEECGTGSHI